MSKSFQLYHELTEKMEILTNRLKQNEIERKELEEVRQDWTSGVTHDLKTPLSYIQGYSTMLLSAEHEWTQKERDQFIKIIQAKAIHMQQLIDDLSDAFQFERGAIPLNLKELDLISFVRDVVEDVRQQPTSLAYYIHYTADKDKLLHAFDDQLLRRALTNFLMNAVLHNPSGTVIAVSISVDRQDSVMITIEDNGVGMNDKEKEHLFQHYYRGTSTDIPVSGTGLGMLSPNSSSILITERFKFKAPPEKVRQLRFLFRNFPNEPTCYRAKHVCSPFLVAKIILSSL